MSKKKIEDQPLQRSILLTVDERSIDVEGRTVELAFSSEIEVERWFGIEVLDHSPNSVRLGRLQDGGALLLDHNHRDQVGVVESVRIDGDRRGRAVVRFGKSDRANDAFQDVVDKIKRHVSVGYRIYKYEVTEGNGEKPDVIRVIDWEPYEISLVSVPADHSVGIGRSQESINNRESETMPGTTDNGTTQQPATPDTTVQGTDTRAQQPAPVQAPTPAPATINTDDAVRGERQRIADIQQAAAQSPWDVSEVSQRAINEGLTVEQFRAAAFEHAAQAPRPAAITASREMFSNEKREFSLIRAINAQMSGDWSQAGFEREMSQELSRSASCVGGGLVVPMSIFAEQRASDTSTAAGLVPTIHRDDLWIDTLRAQTLLGRLGARFLPGLNGKLTIPKKTKNATFGWKAEGDEADSSNVEVGNAELSGKHVSGIVPMTFELMRQSAPAIEQLVRMDMLEGIALAIDLAGLQGTGSNNQPTGILNTTGIGTVEFADKTGMIPTWKEVIAMEGAVDDANALLGQLSYVFRPTVHSTLKGTSKDTGSGRFIIENRECNGYGAFSSTQVPDKTSLFGNFNDCLVGLFGAVEIIPDRNAKTGGLDLGVHQLADVTVRHAQSFVKGIPASA